MTGALPNSWLAALDPILGWAARDAALGEAGGDAPRLEAEDLQFHGLLETVLAGWHRPGDGDRRLEHRGGAQREEATHEAWPLGPAQPVASAPVAVEGSHLELELHPLTNALSRGGALTTKLANPDDRAGVDLALSQSAAPIRADLHAAYDGHWTQGSKEELAPALARPLIDGRAQREDWEDAGATLKLSQCGSGQKPAGDEAESGAESPENVAPRGIGSEFSAWEPLCGLAEQRQAAHHPSRSEADNVFELIAPVVRPRDPIAPPMSAFNPADGPQTPAAEPLQAGPTQRSVQPPTERFPGIPEPSLPLMASGTADVSGGDLAFAVRLRDASDPAARIAQIKLSETGREQNPHAPGMDKEVALRLAVSHSAPPQRSPEGAPSGDQSEHQSPAGARVEPRATSYAGPRAEASAPPLPAGPVEVAQPILSVDRACSSSAVSAPTPAPEREPAPDREVRQITLRVDGVRGERLQLQLQDRAGEIHVAVSSRDPALAGSLREGAGQLVRHLETRGFSAELLAGPASTNGALRWPEATDGPSTGVGARGGTEPEQYRGGDHRGRRNRPNGAWEADTEAMG